jgi:hypothetical protein
LTFKNFRQDEDEDEREVMSMMSGTDVFRKEDKVRVFGANLDSKIASRGQGLQNYDEKEVPAEVMDQILLQVCTFSRRICEFCFKN